MNISGIQIEKSSDGSLKSITFDAKKFENILKPILDNLGLNDPRLEKKFFSLEEAKAETKKRLLDKCKAERKS